MAKFHVRLYIRVKNPGQWAIMDELIFSDVAKELFSEIKPNGRELFIDKMIDIKGIPIASFFEFTMPIEGNLGEVIVLNDMSNAKESYYLFTLCDKSGRKYYESEIEAPSELLHTDIKDVKTWLKASGKKLSQKCMADIETFFGEEPKRSVIGPWSIEKEIELRHEVFSAAANKEIADIGLAEIKRIFNVVGNRKKTTKELVLKTIIIGGQIGAAHGRMLNNEEKEIFDTLSSKLFQFTPTQRFEHQTKLREDAKTYIIKNTKEVCDAFPDLASSILNFAFCFIYADGKTNAKDKELLESISSVISVPMSKMQMLRKFNDDTPNAPIDYAGYVSAVNVDTFIGVDDPSDIMQIDFGDGAQNVRVIKANLSDDDDDEDYFDESDDSDYELLFDFDGNEYEIFDGIKVPKLKGHKTNIGLSKSKQNNFNENQATSHLRYVSVPKSIEFEEYKDTRFSVSCVMETLTVTAKGLTMVKGIENVISNDMYVSDRMNTLYTDDDRVCIRYDLSAYGEDNGVSWARYFIVAATEQKITFFQIFINGDYTPQQMMFSVKKWASRLKEYTIQTEDTTFPIVTFGKYKQDVKSGSKETDIEWYVISKEKDRMLLISRYCLEAMPYDKGAMDAIWSKSSSRKWLNGAFYEKAFNDKDKGSILTVKNKGDSNSSPVSDKVFFLSVDEVEKYFSTDGQRASRATPHAQKNKIIQANELSPWWLRTAGTAAYNAAGISAFGYISENGVDSDCEEIGVRPAIWVKSNASLGESFAENRVNKDIDATIIKHDNDEKAQSGYPSGYIWEEELEKRHKKFSKLSKSAIIRFLKEEFKVVTLTIKDKDATLNMLFSAGRIGCCHGRCANADEIEVLTGVIENLPALLGMILSKKLEDDDINEIIRDIKPSINKYPQIASPFLNMVFAFVYADGEVETTDKRYIDRLEPIIASKLDYDETEPKVKSSKPSIIAPTKSTSNVKKPTVSSKPQTELSDEEIESKILDTMKDGERYITHDLHSFEENIHALSIQKLSAVLRKMTQKGALIKVEENNIGYYYSVKALYDKTVKNFDTAQKNDEFDELIKKFNMLGKYEKSVEYAEKCRDKMNEINYEEANLLMQRAKSPNGFKKASVIFEKLGDYRDSKSKFKLCNVKIQELENAKSYDEAVKKMNDAKSSAEMLKVVPLFEALETYRDSQDLVVKCKEQASVLKEEEHKQSVYNKAIASSKSKDVAVLTQAVTKLESLSGWKDVDTQIQHIRTKISEIIAEEERQKIELAQKEKKKKIITVAVVVSLAAILIFAIIYSSVIKPSTEYNEAIDLMNAGNYTAAADIFHELDDYKDSKSKLNMMCKKNPALKFYISDIGDVVSFGKYNQGSSVKEIEWYVLAKEDDKVLLISRYILEAMTYEEMKSFINDGFYNSAFSSAEKKYCEVFIPNPETADKYADALEDGFEYIIKTEPTQYALSKGLKRNIWYNGTDHGYAWWLNQSVQSYSGMSCHISYSIQSNISLIDISDIDSIVGVRPFVWIDVEQ